MNGEATQLVVFQVGAGDQFALPIERVQEVVRYEPPRRIASNVPWLRGVMSLRGVVLPVCDLASRLAIEGDHEPARLLITAPTGGEGSVAFAVGAVHGISSIDAADIEPAADWHDPAVTGIGRIEDRIVVVLDPDQLCRSLGEAEHQHPFAARANEPEQTS